MPRRVCYRPALFFRRLLTVLSVTQGKIQQALKKNAIFFI
jgi:hypothetical protein